MNQSVLIAGLIGAFLILGSTYKLGEQRGHESATLHCLEQRALQESVNSAAIDKAADVLEERINQMVIESEKLENLLAENDAAAFADPDADVCGISAGSVQRINSIR